MEKGLNDDFIKEMRERYPQSALLHPEQMKTAESEVSYFKNMAKDLERAEQSLGGRLTEEQVKEFIRRVDGYVDTAQEKQAQAYRERLNRTEGISY